MIVVHTVQRFLSSETNPKHLSRKNCPFQVISEFYHLPRGVFLQIQNDICSVISKYNVASPQCVNLYAQLMKQGKFQPTPPKNWKRRLQSKIPKSTTQNAKNGRWSLTRIEPREVSLRRKPDTSTLRKRIYCMQFPSYDMCSSMLMLFLLQGIAYKSLKTMQNH